MAILLYTEDDHNFTTIHYQNITILPRPTVLITLYSYVRYFTDRINLSPLTVAQK